jgi:hypothetical protein
MCTEEEMRAAHTTGNYDALIEDTAGLVVTNYRTVFGPYQDDMNCTAYTNDYGGSPIGTTLPQGRLARISSLVGPTDGLPYSWIGFGYAECSDAHPLFCCR